MEKAREYRWIIPIITLTLSLTAAVLVSWVSKKRPTQTAFRSLTVISPTMRISVTAEPTITPTAIIEVSPTPEFDNNIQSPIREDPIEEFEKFVPDTDGDGVKDISDNCPFIASLDQQDSDNNGVGDACYILELVDEDLAKRLQGNVEVLGIRIDQITEVVWPDSCLGTPSQQPCTPVETPGYRLILQVTRASGQKYLYHTDKIGNFQFIGLADI